MSKNLSPLTLFLSFNCRLERHSETSPNKRKQCQPNPRRLERQESFQRCRNFFRYFHNLPLFSSSYPNSSLFSPLFPVPQSSDWNEPKGLRLNCPSDVWKDDKSLQTFKSACKETGSLLSMPAGRVLSWCSHARSKRLSLLWSKTVGGKLVQKYVCGKSGASSAPFKSPSIP